MNTLKAVYAYRKEQRIRHCCCHRKHDIPLKWHYEYPQEIVKVLPRPRASLYGAPGMFLCRAPLKIVENVWVQVTRVTFRPCVVHIEISMGLQTTKREKQGCNMMYEYASCASYETRHKSQSCVKQRIQILPSASAN